MGTGRCDCWGSRRPARRPARPCPAAVNRRSTCRAGAGQSHSRSCLKTLGQQRDLLAVLAFDESLHTTTLLKRVARIKAVITFSHSLGQQQTTKCLNGHPDKRETYRNKSARSFAGRFWESQQ